VEDVPASTLKAEISLSPVQGVPPSHGAPAKPTFSHAHPRFCWRLAIGQESKGLQTAGSWSLALRLKKNGFHSRAGSRLS